MSDAILTAPPPPADYRLPYGPDPLQFGDLRLPQGPGPRPVVIVIHGGFWRERWDLTHAGHLCAALAAEGYATWSIEYRRVGNGGGWPHTFTDVGMGVDHVRVLAPEYRLDLERAITLGHSAGGQLALWAAGRQRVPDGSAITERDGHEVDGSLSLAGAVSLAGVVDLVRSYELHLGGGITAELLGGTPEQVPDRYAAASPAALLPLGVRQVLVHGTEDENVPFTLSETYVLRAAEAGDDVTLIGLPGTGHFEVIDPSSAVWKYVLTATRYLLASTQPRTT